jgi:hypothetical protein
MRKPVSSSFNIMVPLAVRPSTMSVGGTDDRAEPSGCADHHSMMPAPKGARDSAGVVICA